MEPFCFMTRVTNQNPSISSDWKKKCFHMVLEHFNRLVNDHANFIPPKGGWKQESVYVWFTFVEQISNKIISIAFHAFHHFFSRLYWIFWNTMKEMKFSFFFLAQLFICSGECMFLKRCTTTQFPIFVWS